MNASTSSDYPFCDNCKIDQAMIEQRMRLFNLSNADNDTCQLLHDLVIEPNIMSIVNNLFHYFYLNEEFNEFVPGDKLDLLKTQRTVYLLTLGKNIGSKFYFESRLKDGVDYQQSQLPLILYESGIQKLRTLILEKMPLELEQSMLVRLQLYVSKIIGFDMSITNDSYMQDAVFDLKKSVNDLQKQNEKYKVWSGLDPLTKTLHKDLIYTAAVRAPEKASKKDETASYVMFSFPDVIKINGEMGFGAGDKFLANAINRVKKSIPNGCSIGRYAANKFLIVLTSKDQDATRMLMRRLKDIVKGRSISVGTETIPLNIVLAGRVYKPGEDISMAIEKMSHKLHQITSTGSPT